MVVVVVLVLLALLVGGIGLFVEALKWMLILALVLLVAGVVMGVMGRGRARAGHVDAASCRAGWSTPAR